MNLRKLIENVSFKSFAPDSTVRGKLGKTDLGILKVALMVAAIDGKVTGEEIEALRLLARTGFGLDEKGAEEAFAQAEHCAGYMLLTSDLALSDAELVEKFMAEACAVLPNGFAYMPVSDVRRAVVTWIALAMSDGDYSVRERLCIEALRQRFAELKANHIEMENRYWQGIPANVRCMFEEYPGSRLKLASKDFVGKVSALIAEFGGDDEARAALDSLIAHGE